MTHNHHTTIDCLLLDFSFSCQAKICPEDESARVFYQDGRALCVLEPTGSSYS
jgi:hypothetical protein